MADNQEEFALNLLPFDYPDRTVSYDFYKTKGKSSMAPLMKREFPGQWSGSDELKQLYTDFKNEGEGDYQLEINLKETPRFAKHYFNRLLFGLFKGSADVRKLNFLYHNEFWFRDEQADPDYGKAYKRFEFRTSIGRYTEGPELLVNYNGHSYLHQYSVLDYTGPTTDLNWVVHEGLCFRYEDVPDGVHINHANMFAVMNRDIRRRLGLGYDWHYSKNKVKRYYDELEWIRKTYILQPSFKQALFMASATERKGLERS
jgi:hypothetical protein